MLRIKEITMATIALMAVACSSPGEEEASAEDGDSQAEPQIDIIEIADGAEGCSYSWNGEAVTPADILTRSAQAVETAVREAGGANNMTEEDLPTLHVQTPPGTRFECLRAAAIPAALAGYPQGELRLVEGEAGPMFDFPIFFEEDFIVGAVLRVDANGGHSWSGESVDEQGIAMRAQSFQGDRRDRIMLVASDEAPVAEIYDALSAVGRSNAYVTLLPCMDGMLPLPSALASVREDLPSCR